MATTVRSSLGALRAWLDVPLVCFVLLWIVALAVTRRADAEGSGPQCWPNWARLVLEEVSVSDEVDSQLAELERRRWKERFQWYGLQGTYSEGYPFVDGSYLDLLRELSP